MVISFRALWRLRHTTEVLVNFPLSVSIRTLTSPLPIGPLLDFSQVLIERSCPITFSESGCLTRPDHRARLAPRVTQARRDRRDRRDLLDQQDHRDPKGIPGHRDPKGILGAMPLGV